MPFELVCIVEGHGEVKALPILIRRYAEELPDPCYPRIHPPIRKPKSSLLQPSDLASTVELANRMIQTAGAILLLIDSDGTCPATLGPTMLARATASSRWPVSVVIAHHEYENWFIGAAESVSQCKIFATPLIPHDDPESIQGAKEYVRRSMAPGTRYSEPIHQPSLTRYMDFTATRQRCPSFDKLARELDRLLSPYQRKKR